MVPAARLERSAGSPGRIVQTEADGDALSDELSAPPTPSQAAKDNRALFFTVFPSIMIPMFLAMIDQTIVSTALPAVAADLGDVERVSWIVVSYLVATTIAAPVYGRLGDVFGRRRVMMVALGVFMAASVICALAPSVLVLSLARVLQGLGGGGLMTSSQALVGETVPPRERARYQGYLAAVAVCASSFGPVVGGFLTEHFGWRSVFLVNLPLGIVAVLLTLRLSQRQGSGAGFRFDFVGLAIFVVFVVSTLIGLERVQHFEAGSLPLIAGLAVLAVTAVFLLVRVERRAASPLLPLSLLRTPAIWRSDALAACHGGALVSLLTLMPIYLRVVRGTSASETGLLLLPLAAGIGLGAMVTGRLVSWTGRTAIFPSIGLIPVAALLVVLAIAAPLLSNTLLVMVFAILSLFMGTVMGVVQVTVQTAAGPAMIGSAAASVQFSRSIGAAFGTSVATAVLFSVLALSDPDAAHAFDALIQTGPGALQSWPAARQAVIVAEVTDAFRAAFLAVAVFATGALALAWSIPMRRLS
jgi:EmrB/QacA subfamily drug resistance transporter